jgi:hypothetical protein
VENENGCPAGRVEKSKKNIGKVCIKKKRVYIYSPSARQLMEIPR